MITKHVFWTEFPKFSGKTTENVAIWLDFVTIWLEFSIIWKGNWKCTKHHYLHGKLWILDFPYINVAKTDYTLGQFVSKIDGFVPKLAIDALRLLNAMFD